MQQAVAKFEAVTRQTGLEENVLNGTSDEGSEGHELACNRVQGLGFRGSRS